MLKLNEFEERLYDVLENMDAEEYIELVQRMNMDKADAIQPMSEFDDVMCDMSPTEMVEWVHENYDFDVDDDYFVDSGWGNLESFNDPTDIVDIDDVVETIELNMMDALNYGNDDIKELIEEHTTISENDVLDVILEALEEGQDVQLKIGSIEYKIKKNEQKEDEKGDE